MLLDICSPIVSLLLANYQCWTDPTQIVETSVGPISGWVNGSTPNVVQFLGIPYAEPPLNQLRFRPPQPKQYRDDLFNAVDSPLSCPQFEGKIPSVYNQLAREFLIQGPQSEDCLTASIWTPAGAAQAQSNLPVFAWLYGGGFQTGGADVPYQQPEKWVERSQRHVVVAINYRVNIFGFPSSRGLENTVQNVGLLDQRLALEWIRDNIANFGGDPSRITLWGQSAGAMSVEYYNQAYATDPIISSMILDSSVSKMRHNADTTHSNFTYIAKNLGCDISSAASELSCMQNLPFTTITTFLRDHNFNSSKKNLNPTLWFGPINDETTKFANPFSRLETGNFTAVPALIGTTSHEGRSLVSYDSIDCIETEKSLCRQSNKDESIAAADALTRDWFLCHAMRISAARAAANATTYRYVYSGNFSNVAPKTWLGAYHSSELPMIFGTYGDFRRKEVARDVGDNMTGRRMERFQKDTSEAMQDLYLAFAEKPVGGLEKWGWKTYGDGVVMRIADGDVVLRVSGVGDVDGEC